MSHSEPGVTFWQCTKCRTPNPSARYVTTCVACGAARPRSAPAASAPRAAATAPSRPRRRDRWLLGLSLGYGVVVLGVLALVWGLGDLWWPATLLEFAPRVVWAVPLLLLGIWNLWTRSLRVGLAHLVVGLVIVGPLMGLKVPLGRLFASAPAGRSVRLLTLNRGADAFEAADLIDLIERERVEVLCFQEPYYPPDPKFHDPAMRAYFAEGWHHTKNWSIVSRHPIVEERDQHIGESPSNEFRPGKIDRATIQLPSGERFRLACIHLPTIRFGLKVLASGRFGRTDEFFAWRRGHVEKLLWLASEGTELPVLLAGDFNAPFASPLFDPIRPLYHEGFESVGLGYAYTRPASWPWIGIDYVLATREWSFRSCRVGPDVGSDHLPVIAEVVLSPPGVD